MEFFAAYFYLNENSRFLFGKMQYYNV